MNCWCKLDKRILYAVLTCLVLVVLSIMIKKGRDNRNRNNLRTKKSYPGGKLTYT